MRGCIETVTEPPDAVETAPNAAPASEGEAEWRMDPRPVTIDGLLGWYIPGRSRRGVVMCGTIGFEQLSAYRGWYSLARAIGAAGCSVLRFDYPGEGDSHDVAQFDADGLLASVCRAVAWMRTAGGADEIALVGLRLGGTLAAMAGSRIGADRVALIAPFDNGARFIREMQVQASVLNLFADGTPIPQPEDHLNVGGFRFDPAFAATLSPIDLATMPVPASHVLLCGRGTGPLAGAYAAAGAQVVTAPFADLAPLLGRPGTAARQPDFATLVAFIADGALASPAVHPIETQPITGTGWTERVERIGGMVGVRCRPVDRPTRAAILFLNAGSNMRSGWGRQVTRIARTLAAEGMTTLRVDLPGMGDSPGDLLDDPSDPALVEQIVRLVDVLALEDAPMVATGVCHGAARAWRGLCADARIDAALLINPSPLHTQAEQREDALDSSFRSTRTYWRMLARPASWRRLATGRIRVLAIMGRIVRRALRSVAKPTAAADRDQALHGRGQLVDVMVSPGDIGVANVRRALGRGPTWTANGNTFTTVPGTDHNFGGEAGEEAMLAGLRSLIDRVVERSRLPSASIPPSLAVIPD